MPRSHVEVQAFMNRERLAGFATVDAEDKPHVVPVFFTYGDGKVCVQTDRNTVKVRNILRNNSVAVAVYSGEEAVIISGKARIVDNEEEFASRIEEQIEKYRLKIDSQGKDSMGIPLLTKESAVLLKWLQRRLCFGSSCACGLLEKHEEGLRQEEAYERRSRKNT